MAMMRFSFCGHFIVAAIVLTGAVNIALTSGRPPIPPNTPYRALLDAKIVIVAMMISLAALQSLCSRAATQAGRAGARGPARDQHGGGRARRGRDRPRQRIRPARPGVSSLRRRPNRTIASLM